MIALALLVLVSSLCVGISVLFERRRQRLTLMSDRRIKLKLVHSINDDRCTGCEACVTVCPTDVLELVSNKSRVQRFDDCIQCEQCALACPTTSLVMHYENVAPPPVRVPDLDTFYRAAPGLYLIGEAAGKPLVKNAANLGRAVVEHLAQSPASPPQKGVVDVVILGSGPGGLSAALSASALGLSYVVLEKDELIASTIARYPKGKHVMAEPYDVRSMSLLPVYDATKEALLADWSALLEREQIQISLRESVEEVRRDEQGGFLVRTTKKTYRARHVVASIGTRGKPRKLGVPGEQLAKVSALVTDPALHARERVIVVGGGDSAVEAAVALAEAGAEVALSYRGKVLSRCKAKNRQAFESLVAARRITAHFSSTVSEITERAATITKGEESLTLDNDRVFVCIGGDAPVKWLEGIGVRFIDKPHMYQSPPTDQVVEALIDVPEVYDFDEEEPKTVIVNHAA